MSEAKTDTVPGLGFKDKEKALDTIKNLEGRDPDYQKLAVKGLIGRAKRTLTRKFVIDFVTLAVSTYSSRHRYLLTMLLITVAFLAALMSKLPPAEFPNKIKDGTPNGNSCVYLCFESAAVRCFVLRKRTSHL